MSPVQGCYGETASKLKRKGEKEDDNNGEACDRTHRGWQGDRRGN